MADPAAPFTWNDMFLLGYGPMDDTHREFVDIVSALLNSPDADVAGHLEAFARHAETHFEQEREWMESTDFPARGCHVDEHNAVMKSVRDVQQMVAAGDVDEARALAKALADWFPGHADYMDSALAHWMSKRSYGGKPVVLRRNVLPAEEKELALMPAEKRESA
jgi:hemerythrin